MPEETLRAPSPDNINKEGSQLHRKETWANGRAFASAPSPRSSCLPSRTPPPHQEVPVRVQVCSRKSWQHLRGQKELGLKKKKIKVLRERNIECKALAARSKVKSPPR